MTGEYFILEKGQKLGPFTNNELMDRPLEPTDMVLSRDENDFKPAHTLPDFTGYFKSEGIYYPTKENTRAYLLRFPAFIIDMVILIFGISIFCGIFFGTYMEKFGKIFTPDLLNNPDKMKTVMSQHQTELWIMQLVILLCVFFYNTLCEASRLRGSVGKYICGLAVVDEAGYSLTFGQAAGRNFGKISYELPSFYIGFFAYILNLAMVWNPMHQAIHDRLSGCFVVRKNA
jgi:uncharacterized RDD family membrane protein YckC